jgi:CDP-diacylglycerol---glycerol-3-phosphate 3-phosphatidyltransferase
VSARPVAETAARPGSGRTVALPNLLSLVRIGIVPVLVVVLFWPGPLARAVAAALFLIACITDFFDGWLARRHGVTTLGQFLDPLADKLIVVAVLIMLAAVDPEPRVPAWMAVVITLRELAVTGLRGVAAQHGLVLAAEELGKYKMIFQMFALEALLLHYRYPVPGTGLEIDFHAGGMVLLWVALVLAVWSGVNYYVRVLRQLRLD